MKKIELTELIQRNLAGGDVPADVQGDYSDEIVDLYIAMAYNGLLFQLATASMNMGDSTALDKFTKAFIVNDVKEDTTRNKFYIDLPIPSANVPWNEAIRYCGPPEEEGSGYIWRSPAASSVMAGLDIETVEQGIRFQIENQRIYFLKMVTKVETLMLKMLMPWEAWDEEDDIGVPAGADSQLFQMVISLMRSADNRQDTINNQDVDELR